MTTSVRARASDAGTLLAGAPAAVPAAAIRDASTLKTLTGLSFVTGKTLQGELRVGRDATGRNVFWLEGLQGRRYPLLGATGRPVTNAVDAEAGAVKLMRHGAATQLRETSEWPGSNRRTADTPSTVEPPADAHGPPKALAIDLEDPAISSAGGEGRAERAGTFLPWEHTRGERGSALTCTEIIERFRSRGIAVEVVDLNAQGNKANARLHAVVRLDNDARGGYEYGKATAPTGDGSPQANAPPRYGLPKNASPEFKRGFWEARWNVDQGRLAAAGQSAGSAGATLRTASGAASAGGRSRPDVPALYGRPVGPGRPADAADTAHINTAGARTPRQQLRDATASNRVRQDIALGEGPRRITRPAGGTSPPKTRTLRSAAASQEVRRTVAPTGTRALVRPDPAVAAQLSMRKLSPDRLTVATARDFLADVASMGPNPVLPEVAGWLQKAHPSYMHVRGGALGREVRQIIDGGERAPVPRSLAEHAQARRWIRFNAGDYTTDTSLSLRTAVATRFSDGRPLRRALDLGSGNGNASRYLIAHGAGTSVTAIDGDGASLRRLKASLPPEARPRLTTVAGDVTRAEYGRNQDLVVAERLFPHLEDAQVRAVFGKASAALRPGGIMVCDFLTTDHGSARSRGANYRTQDQAVGLVPDSFRVLSQTSSGGMLRLTLQKRE